MLERGVRIRHSCLEFRFRVGVRTLALHILSLCVSVWSRVRSSVHVCFVVLHVVRSFMLYLVLCDTQLVYSLAYFLSEHVACEFSH